MCPELRSLAVELAPAAVGKSFGDFGSSRVRVTHGVAQHNQDPGRGAEPGGADQRDEGHLLPRSSRAAGLVSSRDTRHLLKARLSHGLIRAAPVAGHPSRCDGTAEPSARWLGPRETPSAAVRGRGVSSPDRRESGRGLLRTFPRRLSPASGGEGRGKAGCLALSWTTERKENPP